MFSRTCMTAIAVMGLALLLAPSAHAEEGDKVAAIENNFREAVDLYKQGRYSDSQRKLKAALALDPRHELAARLVDEAGTKVMAEMMADVRMGSEPSYIWQLYRQYKIRKMADVERMKKMAVRLVDDQTSADERALLYREFGELGHHAVPVLAPYLKDATHETHRTYARIAIARMGPRAVLPVIELTRHADVLMRTNAIAVLGDITPADPRALPALKERLEKAGEEGTVTAVAAHVYKKISGMDGNGKSAADSYHDAANRYFLDRAGVAEEAEDVEGMTWHLNEAGELIAVAYPLWAWNDQVAEELTLRGLGLANDHTGLQSLWAAVLAAQWTETKDLLDITNEVPPSHNFSVEEKKDVEEWEKKLVDARRLIAAVGKENVNAALNKVLEDIKRYPGHTRLPAVAVALARELGNLDPNGDLLSETAGVSGLANGLDSAELGVQYASALTIARIDKFPAKYAGAEKVGLILGRGVSENKALQILLVEENPNAANELSGKLSGLGFGVTVAISGRDAVVHARSFPPKDIAIVSDQLRRDLGTEQFLEEMRSDVRTRYLAYGVLHATADRTAAQGRFGSDIPLVERETGAADLKTQVDAIVAKRPAESLSKKRAAEMSLECATVLAGTDPRDTNINVADAIEHAVLALTNRPDDLRIQVCNFLARAGGVGLAGANAGEALKAVILDEKSSVELRRAALVAYGRVVKTGVEEVAMKVQGDADQAVKDHGAEAFGQTSRAGKAIFDFISTNRIEKDKKTK